jgi:hypothetical protein
MGQIGSSERRGLGEGRNGGKPFPLPETQINLRPEFLEFGPGRAAAQPESCFMAIEQPLSSTAA